MFLQIPKSEINVSKDITIIFINSDKLPSKEVEIIISTNTILTYLKMDKSIHRMTRKKTIKITKLNKINLSILIVHQVTAKHTIFSSAYGILPVLSIWLGL